MKNNELMSVSVRGLLSNQTVAKLVSIAKNINIKGYSGKTKSALVELIYPRITDRTFLEDLFLICDHCSWEYILTSSTDSSPTQVPNIVLSPCEALAELCLLQCTKGDSCSFIVMPAEIKEVFAQFSADGYMERKAKADLLDRYALAVTHLYGLIRQDEFVSIFNAQNSVKTDVDEMFSVLIQHVQSDAPYGFWDDYLTHSLFEENEYKDTEDLLSALTGKQRFIPERSLLLQYSDPNFIERSPASNRFMRFFCDKMSCSERIAADITSEFSFACQVDASIGKALGLLDTYDLRLTKDRAKELIPLLVDLSNHTRKWSNCGFTPEEIHQQKIRSSSVRQGRKIGRNEPCPCGSGKKYKKCCGF